jgi:hypothetical protein
MRVIELKQSKRNQIGSEEEKNRRQRRGAAGGSGWRGGVGSAAGGWETRNGRYVGETGGGRPAGGTSSSPWTSFKSLIHSYGQRVDKMEKPN